MRFHPAPGKPLASGVLGLILATAALLPAAGPAMAREADLRAELDGLFAEAWPPGEPGAAVLVARGDGVVLRKGYGMADLELGVPIAPDMVFRLGSITKQFTGAAILLLVDDGELSLDATLGEILPDYDGPAARVTVHQLLTHTGGVPSYTEPDEYRDRMREDVTPEAMIQRFRDEPLEFEPGTSWKYSNSGYFLLGAVIEELSGTDYEDFVESRIFEPLGMHRTRYGHVAEIVPGRVEGYQGEPGSYENAAYLSMTQPYAAGSLLSTVDDLARWDRALRTDELLPSELRELLWTPAELADGRSTGYGYGFTVKDYQGHGIVRHGGSINGFTTAMLRIPDAKVFVAVLSNNPSAQPDPGELALEAATRALGEPLSDRPSVSLRVLPESETRFFLEEVEAAIEFHGAEDGRADSLTLFQAGQEMQGERIEE